MSFVQKNSRYAFWYTNPPAGPQPTYGSVESEALTLGCELMVSRPKSFSLINCLAMKLVSLAGASAHQGNFLTSFLMKLAKTLQTSDASFGHSPHILRRVSAALSAGSLANDTNPKSPYAGDARSPKRPLGKSSHVAVRRTYEPGRLAQKMGRTSSALRVLSALCFQGRSRLAVQSGTRPSPW